MFTYIDPTIRERLTAQGSLFQVDRDGVRFAPDVAAPGGHTISVLGPIPLPLQLCERHFEVEWYACVRNTELGKIEELADDLRAQDGQRSFATLASYMAVNSVMVIGDPSRWENPLVRVHSSCLTGDVFGSQRCECGPQMQSALARISGDEQGGLLVYMAGHEGRGIGLWAKAATYLLQDAGEARHGRRCEQPPLPQRQAGLGPRDRARGHRLARAYWRHSRRFWGTSSPLVRKGLMSIPPRRW